MTWSWGVSKRKLSRFDFLEGGWLFVVGFYFMGGVYLPTKLFFLSFSLLSF